MARHQPGIGRQAEGVDDRAGNRPGEAAWVDRAVTQSRHRDQRGTGEDHDDAQQRGRCHLLLEEEPLDAEGHHREGIKQQHRSAGVEPAQALEIAEGLRRPEADADEGDAPGAFPERSAETQPGEADPQR